MWDPLPSATTSDLAIEECKHVVSYVLLIAKVVTYYRGKLLKQLLFLGNEDFAVILVLQLRSIEILLRQGATTRISAALNIRDFAIEFCTREPSIVNEHDGALYVMLMMERHQMWSCLTETEVMFSICYF